MSTQMTARIPVTSELHERLREAVKSGDTSTYDEYLRTHLFENENQDT